jgi:4-hydroxy-4-methyl-2-oxoglutarate aldolase
MASLPHRFDERSMHSMIFNTRDRIEQLTPLWKGDRLDDGRPLVSDDIIERMKLVTNDEAWGILERPNGYHYQFEGNWSNTQPELVLTGRAITAVMVPLRPDLNEVVEGIGASEGRSGSQNTWVIDSLQPNDVLVVDLFGKIHDGTFVGDNLSTAAHSRTGTGLVIHGGIRDYYRILELSDFPVFHRGVDPSAIANVTLVGVNIPIRIGSTTVLPGDIVLGTKEGITFIPPHLAEEVVLYSEDTRQRDVFGKQRLAEQRYTSGQIDVPVWADDIEADYISWCEEQGLPVSPR